MLIFLISFLSLILERFLFIVSGKLDANELFNLNGDRMAVSLYHWIIFNVLILILLAIDLFRFYRNPHPISVKEALLSSAGWIFLALLFNFWIYVTFGAEPALAFLTGYLVEESLSVDNLFIFLVIFSHFQVPETAKHQVLFYGVLGAIVMRALLIWAGILLIKSFDWIFILFGLFLIFTGIHLAFKKESEKGIEKSYIYRLMQKWMPLTTYHGNAFLVKINGQWMATPLLTVLILIETTDLIFALDSVPAILGITTEPFLVYTSNIFAILGLRSLFFALEGVMQGFYLLHYALAFILIFIGCKMIFSDVIHVPPLVTLLVLAIALTLAITGSLLFPNPAKKEK
jgi:tellurite resistance protein TerC